MGGLYLEGLIHGGAYFRNFTVCSIIVTAIEFFCEDYDGNRRNPGDIWLENPQLKCRCLDNNFAICDSLPKPMCQDINGIFRKNMESWMTGSCVECACIRGTINCTQTIVSITYGLYNVSVYPTCEGCTSQETLTFSACKGEKLVIKYCRGTLKVHLKWCYTAIFIPRICLLRVITIFTFKKSMRPIKEYFEDQQFLFLPYFSLQR